ncbi:MAG: hypothetical protein M3O30_04870 [Planctomycetota bacterium]|nr:hypothetical protein [Planctomycetota bacterium]
MSVAIGTSFLVQRIIETDDVPLDPDGRTDILDIDWQERGKRALRATTRQGRLVRILLPANQFLDHGSVLISDEVLRIIVNISPCELLVVAADSAQRLATLAYAIGNAHLPAEIRGGKILIPASDATEAGLGQLGIPFQTSVGRVMPECDLMPRISINLDSGRR